MTVLRMCMYKSVCVWYELSACLKLYVCRFCLCECTCFLHATNLAKTRSGNRHAVCGLLLIVNTYIHTYIQCPIELIQLAATGLCRLLLTLTILGHWALFVTALVSCLAGLYDNTFLSAQPQVVSVMEADSTPAAEKQASVQPVPNSMPVVDGWQGNHRFQVTVRPRPAAVAGRQLPYVYSGGDAAKLYTDMMVAVPFSFTYFGVMDPSALRIRALPIYKESHHIQTPVRRCAIHREAGDPSNTGGQPMHVVRVEHPRAR